MNKLDFSQVVDPSKRQPVPRRSWEFLQNAFKTVFNFVGATFVGDDYSTSVGYICYLGRKTGAVIDNAFVFFNGEWYLMTGADTTAYVNVPVVIADNTNGAEDPITFTDTTTGNVHNVRQLKIADQVSGTGLFDYSAAVFVQDRRLLTKIVNIGDWDMDSTDTVTPSHGLTAANIRKVSVTIRNDSGSNYSDLIIPQVNTTSDFPQTEGTVSWGSTTVTLRRRIGGAFDNTSYDQTSYNRGWITIDYVV